jgi:hypothetical protein
MFWTQDSQNKVDFNRPKPHKCDVNAKNDIDISFPFVFANNYLTVRIWKSVHFRSIETFKAQFLSKL